MRAAAIGALLLAVAATGFLLARDGDEPNRLVVELPEATNVIAGQFVRAAGVTVGRVGSIDAIRGGNAARVTLEIDDEVWPLPQGTRFRLRQGGTISFANRYIALRRGPDGAPDLDDGARIPTSDFDVPVEFDRFLGIYDAATRTRLKAFVDTAGPALTRTRQSLRNALAQDKAPAALETGGTVLRDLDESGRNLKSLIITGDRVTAAIQQANPRIGSLLEGAAGTFSAIADESQNVQQTLERTPALLSRTRTTLAHASSTLSGVGELTDDLRPGVAELRRVARPTAQVLQTLNAVGPDAKATLRSLRRATPPLNTVLTRLTRETLGRLGSIGEQGEEAVRCIRPYSPEIAGFFTNWTSFGAFDDGRNKALRLGLLAYPYPNATPLTSKQVTTALPQLKFAFPRPPGTDANQPWFLPECDAGEDSYDAGKDPLARGFTLGKNPFATNADPEEGKP